MKTLCVISLVLVTWFQLVAADCRVESSCRSISIKYPFGTDDGCGHPDYRLNCTGDGLELRLKNSASIFHVGKIDYDTRSISFSEAPMSSGTCPLEDLPTGMQISFCNSNSSSSAQVLCMSSNSTCCVERAQGSQPCPLYRQRTTVATTASSQLADTSWSTGALSFVWNSPLQRNCSDCQSSKGKCGYNSTNSFICICGASNTTNQCPDCLNGSCKTTKKPIILSGSLAIAVIVVVLFFGVSLSIYWKWKKNGREEEKEEPLFSVQDPKQQADLRELLSSRRGDPARVFSVAEMEKATNGFAKEHKLGTGGFGTVYKGVFDDGSVMAIKKANHSSKHSSQHFYNEVTILSQVNHRNLVRLIGCCIETDVPMLAYEYIPNGTLFEHLHRKPGTLSWYNRLRIAIETAEALAYLHSAAFPPIYHRDVKTSNILLDNNYVAKVADFGLSRLVPVDATHVSTMVQGTPGYVDPEYYQTYQLTDKSDVYSFGVVLLEMVTGQKPVDFSRASRDVNLSAFSVPLIKKGMLEDLIDPKLEANGDLELVKSIKSVANVAVLCLSFFREDRPTMKQVLEELLAIRGSSRLGQVPSDHWLEGELIMVNSYAPSGGISYNSISSNSVRDENSTELTPR